MSTSVESSRVLNFIKNMSKNHLTMTIQDSEVSENDIVCKFCCDLETLKKHYYKNHNYFLSYWLTYWYVFRIFFQFNWNGLILVNNETNAMPYALELICLFWNSICWFSLEVFESLWSKYFFFFFVFSKEFSILAFKRMFPVSSVKIL